MALVKSPLKYPGGKSRAVKQLLQLMPPETKEMVSPFFGGGNFELNCAMQGIKIHGYDIYPELVNFWQKLIENNRFIYNEVMKYYPLHPDTYHYARTQYEKMDKWAKAVWFYIFNKTNFNGNLYGTISYGFRGFKNTGIEKLAEFKPDNLTVEIMDFKKSLNKHKELFAYLDPPYMIKSPYLYGKQGEFHKFFPHTELNDLLYERKNWILSYNDCVEIRDLYADFEMIKPKWTYSMANTKRRESNELFIFSNDLKHRIP